MYVLCGVYACVYMCVLIVNTSDCLYLQVIEETNKKGQLRDCSLTIVVL